jgi:integrase
MRPDESIALTWDDVDLEAGACTCAAAGTAVASTYPSRTASARSRSRPPARRGLDELAALDGYIAAGLVFRNRTGRQLTPPTLTAYWKEVRARARLDRDFYVATKHCGVWYMKVVLGLPDAAIAAQAGWSERSVTKMVETYAHAVDERRLDEIDVAFQREAEGDAASV